MGKAGSVRTGQYSFPQIDLRSTSSSSYFGRAVLLTTQIEVMGSRYSDDLLYGREGRSMSTPVSDVLSTPASDASAYSAAPDLSLVALATQGSF
jgi:hypothetical protein